MKKLKLLFGVLLVTGVFTLSQVNAQDYDIALVNDIAYLYLGGETLETSDYNYVETNNGNYTVNITWYLTPGNEFIPNKGTNKVLLTALIDITFFPNLILHTTEGEATINKHGKCHIVLHINGSTTP